MNDSKHTPEPWHTRTNCPGRCCFHLFAGPIYGHSDDSEYDGECISSPELCEADAARIVACVNACAGMSDAWAPNYAALTISGAAALAAHDRIHRAGAFA